MPKLNSWVNILKTKILAAARYRVVGVIDGNGCPAEQFLASGESTTRASRLGLFRMLEFIADNGLQAAPSAWYHEANKPLGVYELIKGDLRLFFFKGRDGDIAVCASGVMKKGRKADTAAVERAARWRAEYESAVLNGTYKVISDEDE